MGASPNRKNLLWLQSGGCGGCTQSLLSAENPDLLTALDAAGIDLIGHPAIGGEAGAGLRGLIDRILANEVPLHLFCLEGAVINGPNGSGRFHRLAGTSEPMRDWVARLAAKAEQVVAVGSCAGFGGITAGGGNPADACGLQFHGEHEGGLMGAGFRGAAGGQVVNIAGCPVHPGWVTETLLRLARGGPEAVALDGFGRPRAYSNHLAHHGCPRNEYYEYKASAEHPGELGCLMEHLGCLGTQARADCNLRGWNGEGSCLRGGFPCINCTAPGFEEPRHPFGRTPKIAGIPVGLPTDMPKAWFVALASLAKAATPERLRENAAADHIRIPPGIRGRPKS